MFKAAFSQKQYLINCNAEWNILMNFKYTGHRQSTSYTLVGEMSHSLNIMG